MCTFYASSLYCAHYSPVSTSFISSDWSIVRSKPSNISLSGSFISKDREKGGHVLGLNIDKADLALDYTQGFEMKLPDNEMLDGFDLTIDQSEDIKEVETGE
ncbi:MAG: acetolactate decarboxylase [Lachnospiraceae bacterium]|nr:acetolactate decarboxylase [Lachnospiraceae bacterium]